MFDSFHVISYHKLLPFSVYPIQAVVNNVDKENTVPSASVNLHPRQRAKQK